jgi:hypothetical protein
MNIEDFRSAGVLPSGPVSAWPQSRQEQLFEENRKKHGHATRVNASAGQMAKGFLQTAGHAIRGGKVTQEIRDERYDTCKNCPFFIEDSKRCSECGCFMEAKTWVNGPKEALCPKNRWSR